MGNEVGEDVVVDLVGGGALAVGGEEEGADVVAEVWCCCISIAKVWKKNKDSRKEIIAFKSTATRTHFWRLFAATLPGRMTSSSLDKIHAKRR